MFFVAARKHIRAVMGELRKKDKPVRRVILAGGGNIGMRLASAIEGQYQVNRITSYNVCYTKLLRGAVRQIPYACPDPVNRQGREPDRSGTFLRQLL